MIQKVLFLHLWAPLDSLVHFMSFYPYSYFDNELQSFLNICHSSMIHVSFQAVKSMDNITLICSHLIYFSVIVKNSNSMKYLTQANDTSEWMCQLYLKYFAFINVCNLTLAPISAFACRIQRGYFDAKYAVHTSVIMLVIFICSNGFTVYQQKQKHFFIIFSACSVPWNQKTFLGYSVNKFLYFVVAVHI